MRKRLYDGLIILPPEATPEVRKTQVKNLEDLVQKCNGTILQKVEEGRKPLGYPIRKHAEGYFLVFHFEMETGKVSEFKNALELHEDILTFMVTVQVLRKDKKNVPKLPSHGSKPVHPPQETKSQTAATKP